MTCIVGVVEGDRIWMGGDSAFSDVNTHENVLVTNQKVFKVGPALIGVSGSSRIGDILRYSLELPKHPKSVDTGRWVRTSFVNAVRDTLRANGVFRNGAPDEFDATVLLGYRGRFFAMQGGDLAVSESIDDFAAIGSGAVVALGALSATPFMPPRKRVLTALGASERYDVTVRKPFYVLQSDK